MIHETAPIRDFESFASTTTAESRRTMNRATAGVDKLETEVKPRMTGPTA